MFRPPRIYNTFDAFVDVVDRPNAVCVEHQDSVPAISKDRAELTCSFDQSILERFEGDDLSWMNV